MSQPNFESDSPGGVLVPKPKSSIYTVLLILSVIALVIACVFLYLEISEYGGLGATKGMSSSADEWIAARCLDVFRV
ncbi:MAG: hypothetical protein JW829_14350 [Pirellulales bacterium]|nr:hypothetical protein [Pirellulales bacterium]